MISLKLKRAFEKIGKAQAGWLGSMRALWQGKREPDAALLRCTEEALLGADLGPEAAAEILSRSKKAFAAGNTAEDFADVLRSVLAESLLTVSRGMRWAPQAPTVWYVAGVNGSGKTTTCAKLAHALIRDGKTVVLGACDTFRAAAAEQLAIWAERIGAHLVRGREGGDPAGVAYQALETAIARKADVLLLDTAGRLHTKDALMDEAKKILRVLQKLRPDAPSETLLVLDGTNGQNAMAQVTQFHAALRLTGLIVAKMDSGAKAGVIVALERAHGVPVKWLGLGEGLDDLEPFDREAYVACLTEGMGAARA